MKWFLSERKKAYALRDQVKKDDDLFPSASAEELKERAIQKVEWQRQERERQIAEVKRKVRECETRGYHKWTVILHSATSWSASIICYGEGGRGGNGAITPIDPYTGRVRPPAHELDKYKEWLDSEKKHIEEIEKEGPWYCVDCQLQKDKFNRLSHPYLEPNEQRTLIEHNDRIIP